MYLYVHIDLRSYLCKRVLVHLPVVLLLVTRRRLHVAFNRYMRRFCRLCICFCSNFTISSFMAFVKCSCVLLQKTTVVHNQEFFIVQLHAHRCTYMHTHTFTCIHTSLCSCMQVCRLKVNSLHTYIMQAKAPSATIATVTALAPPTASLLSFVVQQVILLLVATSLLWRRFYSMLVAFVCQLRLLSTCVTPLL